MDNTKAAHADSSHHQKNTESGSASRTDEEDLPRVFERLRSGQKSLESCTIEVRCQVIQSLKRVIRTRREEIVSRIQQATRKSRTDALVSEIIGVLEHLQYLQKNGKDILADQSVSTPLALFGKSSRIFYEPLGVVLVIAPWNYPLYESLVPLTSAFLPGNAVVFKPSEHTPMEGLIESLLDEAGFESDWYEVVYGGGETGRALIDQEPDHIFFTGSKKTGKQIMKQASESLIPVDLELGGKDPMIVFDDVNTDRASAGAIWGGMTCSGQSCTSVEKLFIQEPLYSEMKGKLVERAEAISVGEDQTDDSTYYEMGGMTTSFQVDTVREHLEDALEKGATQLTGQEWDRETVYVPPIVLEDVSENMLVAQEETFGPILPLYTFEREEEVIRRANDTSYGLSASVWSADMDRADRVARKLETGNVSINNVMITEGNPALPFGGTKESGIGRFKGEYGLRSFTNIKAIMSEGDSGAIEPNWYPYDRKKFRLFNQLIDALYEKGLLSFCKIIVYGLWLELYSKFSAKPDEES